MANQAYNPISFSGGSGGGAVSVAFKTIQTAGQTDIVADTATDTLFLSAMGNFAVEHHATTDTIILSAGGGSGFDASDIQSNSGSWDSVYTSTNTNSANWDATHTDVHANSANWSYAASNSGSVNSFDIMMAAEVFR
jgi:hypothetical protein